MTAPKLPLAQYRFSFDTHNNFNDITLSPNLLHSQFGRALREVVPCISPQSECKNCMFQHYCDYAFLFYGVRPAKTQVMRKYETIPVPYCFQPDTTHTNLNHKTERFTVNMTLLGSASDYLPRIIAAMKNIQQSGLGKHRAKPTLKHITHLNPHALDALVYTNDEIITVPNTSETPIPPCPKHSRIDFLTPYRDKAIKHHTSAANIDIAKLLMSLVRRVSLLQTFYTETPPTADFTQLKQLTLNADKHCVAQQLNVVKNARLSAKQQKPINTSGITGSFDLSLEGLEALWPYLYLGQFVNVGQNASMGYGRYQLMLINV